MVQLGKVFKSKACKIFVPAAGLGFVVGLGAGFAGFKYAEHLSSQPHLRGSQPFGENMDSHYIPDLSTEPLPPLKPVPDAGIIFQRPDITTVSTESRPAPIMLTSGRQPV